MVAKKQQVLVKLVVDSREQDNSWLDKFKFDKKFSTEKIKIDSYEVKTPFKCNDFDGKAIKTSTGDVGYEYSFDNGETWNKSNLSIELKKDEDFSSTLFSSYTRFSKEIERTKEYGLDFYIVYNQSTRQMKEHFDKLKSMRRVSYYSNPEKVVYDRMIELSDLNIPLLYTHEIHELVKRLIKHHIKKYKIQYKNVDKI
ncbi:MAG: hypothetical protein ACRCZ0_11880 [Cetobacterium sp.]